MNARQRKAAEEWIIQDDEFHPDPKVAARYANRKALQYTVNRLTDEIRRLDARLGHALGDPSRGHIIEMRATALTELTEAESRLRDHDEFYADDEVAS